MADRRRLQGPVRNPAAHYKLANLLLAQGRTTEAEQEVELKTVVAM